MGAHDGRHTGPGKRFRYTVRDVPSVRENTPKTKPATPCGVTGLMNPNGVDYETMPRGDMVFQEPRVKSGMVTGQEPVVTERVESSMIEDQEAAS